MYSGVVASGLQAMPGGFQFSGPATGGGTLDVKLRTRDGLLYRITASASGFTLAGAAAPSGTTTIRVGDDCFAATVACRAAGQTEVCRPSR